ncbi:MAG: DinB family protein [Gemmatimonadaceae bacterium]
MLAYITKLYDHLAWADARVLDGLRSASGSDPRALELYAHVIGAEHVWLARLEERAATVAVWPALSLDDAAALAAENVRGFRAFLSGLDAGALAREVAYRNSAGLPFRTATEDILIHVAMHGTYHRGQVALVVRNAGGEPAPTDFIAYVRGAPAATRVAPKP